MNPNDYIFGELYNDIKYKYKFFRPDDENEILAYAAGYRIRSGDKVIIIGLDYIVIEEIHFDYN